MIVQPDDEECLQGFTRRMEGAADGCQDQEQCGAKRGGQCESHDLC